MRPEVHVTQVHFEVDGVERVLDFDDENTRNRSYDEYDRICRAVRLIVEAARRRAAEIDAADDEGKA